MVFDGLFGECSVDVGSDVSMGLIESGDDPIVGFFVVDGCEYDVDGHGQDHHIADV